MNQGIATALTAIGAAQALKVPIKQRITGEWDWSVLLQTGGMPSSHSAGVTALATYVAWKKGLRTVDFALSTIFGMIVMYDAMGVRRYAGETAMEVNDLKVEVEKLAKEHPGIYHKKREKELKEMLGHMPREVAAGSLLGLAVGTLSYWLVRS
jgi:acid phosphatase family membrane protein YuiD